MDLRDTPEEAAFRARLRAWLEEHAPKEPAPKDWEENHRWRTAWHRKLYQGGWVGLSWPTEFGGQGLGPIEEAIFSEEIARAEVPGPHAASYIGRAISMFGTEEQRARYLPRFLGGEERWCQGFSEPGAGSDLGGLSTRALLDGDEFVVNGSKIWTSGASLADMCFLLCRTDPDAAKHKGISVLLVDMTTPGIDVQPIVQVNHDRDFAQVFFTDVRVPRGQLLGELGQGWSAAMLTLAYERGPVDIGFQARDAIFVARLAEEIRAKGRAADPLARSSLARAATMVEVLRWQCMRSLTKRLRVTDPGSEGSIDKLHMAQTEQTVLNAAMTALSPGPVLADEQWFNDYLYSRAATIYGGTAQVQKNILATRVLGLPR